MQGDIFSFSPSALIREDIDLLVAHTLPGSRSVFARYRVDLAGKGIDTSVDFGNRQPGNFNFDDSQLGTIKYRFTHGILLTHSCDIENEILRTLALIRPLSTLLSIPSKESDVVTIRGNQNYNYYYLPESKPGFYESYVDLRAVTTISDVMLAKCDRILSLSDEALKGLYSQAFLCMTHSAIDPGVLGAIEIEQ